MDDLKKQELRKRVGQGLAVARETKGLTQKQVEDMSHIVRANRLSQIELGKVSLSAEEFVAFCEFYGTTPDIVVGINSGLSTNIYRYKVDQAINKLSSKESEMLMHLLYEYLNHK